MGNIAVYAGSFCPFTKGHEDIGRQALPLFDKIIVAIGRNRDKTELFDEADRKRWVQKIYQDNPKIQILSYSGLTVELCRRHGAHFLIRGVRNARDFAAEQELAEVNKRLAPEIETVLFLASPELRMVSSSMVRELWHFGEDYSPFLSYELPENG